MQVSAQNSLTWLQTAPAAVAAADQISSAYGQVSPGDDASGADSGQAAISALQSPAQMFAPASLDTLISSQSDTAGSDPAAGAAASAAPPAHHHRHHHGGAAPTTDPQDAASASGTAAVTATTASDAADTSAQADLSQVLMEM